MIFEHANIYRSVNEGSNELRLPDDNVSAMVKIRNILHLRWDEVQDAEGMTIEILKHIACLVAKYKCANALILVTRP